MNIVFVTNSIGFGGAEKMIAFVANGMYERGHQVTIVNYNAIEDYINTHQQTFLSGIQVYSFTSKRCRKLIFFEKIVYLYKIAKKVNANIIVGFTSYPGFSAKIVGDLLHIPSIMSERGNPFMTYNLRNIPTLLTLFFINRSKGAVFQTEGASLFYNKKLRKRGCIIPNPIAISPNLQKANNIEKSIVTVGRLNNNPKRYDIMLQGFALFAKKHPEYSLKLYGKGEDEDNIKILSKQLGIEQKVCFMGVSNNPMKDICNSEIFVITSDYEGISNALLEAMAIGMPCISTDSPPGGARMLIQNKINGLLIPIGDYNALAKAMCKYIEDKEFAFSCGQNAKKVTERFHPIKILNNWEEYFNSILNNK